MSGGSNIEDRIVSIKFDNAAFDQKISETMSALDHLSQKLGSMDPASGFGQIQAAANNVNLSNISNGIDSIGSKLSALGAVGFTVIQGLTQKLGGFVTGIAQNDILGPIITGGKTRAEEIAQAQFQFQGLGLNTQEVMQNALDAVKGTAFGLGDAVKAAAQFGASGVQAGDQMTTSLRAIAGVAAITGTQFNQMSYLFTQGAAKGHIDNQDLMQFATNGFNAAAAFAKQTGTTEAAVHDMASKGQLDYADFAKAMDAAFGSHATDANQTFQGSLDNLHAALGRLGASFFSPQLNQSRDLFNTLGPVVDTLNSKLQPLFFTLNANRGDALTGIDNFLKNVDFSSLDFAIPNIAQGLQNIFNFLKQIGTIAKDAFKEIFPTGFGVTLVLVTDKFEELTQRLTLVGPTADKVKDIFQGFFAILDIGWAVIKGVVTVIEDIFHALVPAGSGLLNLGASTGSFLTKMDQLLVKGGLIQEFFTKLGSVIAIPVGWIGELSQKIVEFFDKIANFGGGGIGKIFDQLQGRLAGASGQVEQVTSVWDKMTNAFRGVFHVLDEIYQGIVDWFKQLFHKIADAMQPADFNSALDAVNVGLLGGITLMLKKFFEGGVKFGFGGGVFNNIKNSLNGLTRSFQLLQTELKADALFKIAEAIALVAASVLVLSLINSADLTKALGAMVFGFGELAATLLALDKVTSSVGGAAKLELISGALIGLAFAMVIFGLAIRELAKLSLGELAKGLGGVGAGMAILVTGVNAISEDTGGLVRAGISMSIIAIALRILADAVKAFSGLSWGEMAKGLVGVSVGLAAIVIAMNAMPPESILNGIGFAIIAVGLRILADAVKAFGSIDMTELAKGLASIIIILAGIALAMDAMPPDLPITAFGVGVLAAALGVMAEVLKRMGEIPFGTMAKALGELAIELLILVVAMNAMQEGILGAAAMVIIAGALTIMVKVLQTLGNMSIKEIAIGLGAVAATLLVLGLSAVALTEAIPEMLLLGVALTAIGAGFALFGAGAFLFVSALDLLTHVGVGAIEALGKVIPALAQAGADFVVNFINDVLVGLPTIIKTLRAVLDQILDTIIKEVPKIAKALEEIITNALELIQKDFPLWVQTGFLVIQSLLDGIESNIGGIVDKVSEIFTKFSNAVVDNMPQIVTAAANMIVAFLDELSNHTDELIGAGINLVVQVIIGLAQGQDQIVAAVVTMVVMFLDTLAQSVGQIIQAGANLVIAIIVGIGSAADQIVTAAANMIISFLTELGKHLVDVINAGVTLVLKIMQGISNATVHFVDACGQMILSFLDATDAAVKKYEGPILSKGIKIAIDILTGIFNGITDEKNLKNISDWFFHLGDRVVGWVKDIGSWVGQIGVDIVKGIYAGIVSMVDWLKTKISDWIKTHIPGWMQFILGINSPSKVMADEVGQYIPQGIMMGIASQSANVKAGISDFTDMMVSAFAPDPKDVGGVWANALNDLAGMSEFNPKITPVLDLTKVQAAAGDISGIIGASPITAEVSVQQAAIISANMADLLSASAKTSATTPTGDVNFNQTINAPTELSTNEIYRNTKSQIVLAKEELGIS